MPEPPEHLLSHVRACLQEARGALAPRAYWDVGLHPEGTTIQVGPRSLRMPFEGYHVFIDLEPGANWSHRALSLLVPADSGLEAQTIPVGFPPFAGEAGPPFELLGPLSPEGAPRRR